MLELDGIFNKEKLGVNVIFGVLLSVCCVGVGVVGVLLYCYIQFLVGIKEFVMFVFVLNVINGGSYVGNKFVMQEFMILFVGVLFFKDVM